MFLHWICTGAPPLCSWQGIFINESHYFCIIYFEKKILEYTKQQTVVLHRSTVLHYCSTLTSWKRDPQIPRISFCKAKRGNKYEISSHSFSLMKEPAFLHLLQEYAELLNYKYSHHPVSYHTLYIHSKSQHVILLVHRLSQIIYHNEICRFRESSN